MTAKRWLGFSLVLIVMSWSAVAHATVTIAPTTLDSGNVVVNQNANATGTLHSTTGGVNVDIVLLPATCTGGGTGTFMLSTPAGLTNVNLNSDVIVTSNYAPTARGAKTCSVEVYMTGTTTSVLAAPFTITGTGVAPVVSVSSTLSFTPTRWNDLAVTPTNSQTLQITNSSTDTGQNLSV